MQADIITRKFLLAGFEVEIDLRHDFSGTMEHLHKELAKSIGNVKNKLYPTRIIGIWQPYSSEDDEESMAKRRYFIGIEVTTADDIPGDLTVKDLPESQFAVFREEQRGTVSRYAYTDWLPSSGYILNEDLMCDMEIFDDLDHCTPDDECDILLPVTINAH